MPPLYDAECSNPACAEYGQRIEVIGPRIAPESEIVVGAICKACGKEVMKRVPLFHVGPRSSSAGNGGLSRTCDASGELSPGDVVSETVTGEGNKLIRVEKVSRKCDRGHRMVIGRETEQLVRSFRKTCYNQYVRVI